MNGFSERLREERKSLNLSQAEFGALGGVKANAQGLYEKGDRSPDAAYITAIAAAGVDVLYLITGQRTPTKEEGLSAREQAVLSNYRALPEVDQAAVQRLTNALAQSAGIEKEKLG